MRYDACEPMSDEEREADEWLVFISGGKYAPLDAPPAVADYLARRKAAVQATWSRREHRIRQGNYRRRWSPPVAYTHHTSRQRSTAGSSVFSSTFKLFDGNRSK